MAMTLKEKRQKIDNIIRKSLKKEDIFLVQVLYGMIYPKNNYESNPEMQQRLNQTIFSDLTEEQLLKTYTPNVFNKLPIEKIEALFQETYNRVMKNNNCEPVHIVSVKKFKEDECSPYCMGYTDNSSNELNLNKDLILKAINNKSNFCNYTSEDIASQYLMIMLHETKHCIQAQNMINFFADEKCKENINSQSALNFANYLLRNIACKDKGKHKDLQFFEEDFYDNAFNEHDANLNAIKSMKTMIDSNKDLPKACYSALMDFSIYAIRADSKYFYDKNSFYEKRIDNMQNQAELTYKLFKKYVKNSPLKTKIMENLSSYIKKEEGISKYMLDLHKDFKAIEKSIKLAEEKVNIYDFAPITLH